MNVWDNKRDYLPNSSYTILFGVRLVHPNIFYNKNKNNNNNNHDEFIERFQRPKGLYNLKKNNAQIPTYKS